MCLLYVAVAAVGLQLLAPPAAYAADNGRWSVYPAASKLGGRPYFYLSADPGSTLKDKVTVTNKADRPTTFRLYGADAYNTARDGGFAVRTRGEKQRAVGAWVRLAKSKVTVAPGKSVTVPFSLAVPEGAEPGDHPGAIVALDERVSGGEGDVAVGIRRAVGARVYLRVGGPTVAALAVEDMRMSRTQPLVPGAGDSTAVITYTLHNRGNVTLNPKATLRAEGLFGRTLLSRELSRVPSELLPRQKVRLTERWVGAPQLDWGDVTLTATAASVRTSGSASFFALPWLAAGVLVVVLGGGGWLWVVRRRRRAS
ncbi:DUF916 domain-containing protein [Streptomyces sp. NBC_01304]|nr:DUF916 domain-containing protein [Streptomyces sp. NBC_01304]